MFKQTISKIIVRANLTVSAYDEQGQEMPFFSGPQNQAMKRIKARIEKQKPCYINWVAEEGANFSNIEGNDINVFYSSHGCIVTRPKTVILNTSSEAEAKE
jgi:hypothetical protein